MRFLADQQDRALRLGTGPDRIVEGHPAQHGHHHRGDFRRHARHVDDRDRLAVAGHAEHALQECRHRVSDQHAGEHEAIAGISLDLVDLALQPQIGRGVASPVHLSHFLVDDAGQVGQQIGDRGIHRQLRYLLPQPALGACRQQAFRQDIRIDLSLCPAGGQENLAMLLEVHQPVRHLQVADIVDRAGIPERRGIFAVGIDHHDMALRRQRADAVQDQRGGGGLAGTRRPDQCEMLAQHRIDIQRGGHVVGGIDRSYADMGTILRGVDPVQVGGGDRKHIASGHRIARHAAAEAGQRAIGILVAFTQEVDVGGDQCAALRTVQRQRADIGDQPACPHPHLYLAANLTRCRSHRIGVRRQSFQQGAVEQDAAARSRYGQHIADRGRTGIGGEGLEVRHFDHDGSPDEYIRCRF